MKRTLAILLMTLALASCIRNDIPYPYVFAAISELSAEGATDVTIDPEAQEVLITLDETYDLKNVRITSVSFSDSRVAASENLVGTHDLSRPISVTLKIYTEFYWTVRAVQPIEREFSVTGQVGSSVIDSRNFRAIANVPQGTDLSKVAVTSLKLGPRDISTYNPPIAYLKDFTEPLKLGVLYGDKLEEWTLIVGQVEQSVAFESLDAWTRVAWLKASGIEGRASGFRIRKAGESEWKEVGGVSWSGASFSAAADSLEPLTQYECCAYCGDETSSVQSFTTEAEAQLPNSGFETVSNAESSKYFSFYDPASSILELQTKWWGSGNKGSTTVGSSYAITLPDESTRVEGERSLMMMSRYVVVKFAAGNVFSGEFSHTIGTSGGVVNMGRPFTLRPRKLTLSLKYQCGKIEDKTLGGVPDGEEVKVGDNDRASVWVALGDWDYRKYGGTADCPVGINTTDKSTFFNPKGESVIAYGIYTADETVGEWTKVEIPLEYTSTSRVPTHIIVSCAASMLGDYFTGSKDSILWVDDLKLEY